MKFMAREFREEYDARIARLRRQFAERAAERLAKHLPDATLERSVKRYSATSSRWWE